MKVSRIKIKKKLTKTSILKLNLIYIHNHAKKLNRQGCFSRSYRFYKFLIEKEKKNFDIFIEYGKILKKLCKFINSEIILKKALNLNPEIEITYYELGKLLKKIGKLDESEMIFRKAIEINHKSEKSFFQLGRVLKELGKLDEAEITLKKVIEINPKFADSFFALANLKRIKGQFKESDTFLGKHLSLKPWSIVGSYSINHKMKSYQFRN